MIAAVAGAGVALGIVLVVRGLRPARPALAVSLAQLRGVDVMASGDAASALEARGARVGRRLAEALDNSGIRMASTRQDLAVLGKPLERFFFDKVFFAVVGLVALPGIGFVASQGGIRISVVFPLWASLAMCAGGFFLPDLLIKGEAKERRRDFRHALSAYLNLVTINLAGGAGVEGALADAVAVGQGWAFERIEEALALSRLSGETPWAALGRLGSELRIDELGELAASLVLAGNEGAKVRESLVAKAESLRRHQAAEAETKAQEASERMTLPIGVLLLGFLIFIGYPAAARLLTSF
jgi:hypothetical protein